MISEKHNHDQPNAIEPQHDNSCKYDVKISSFRNKLNEKEKERQKQKVRVFMAHAKKVEHSNYGCTKPEKKTKRKKR